jgi:hypothetical protein
LRFFLMRHAAAIFDIPEIHLGALLRLKDFGVEHVTERRVIHLGRLNVIHGHEYPGGASSPVNPARGLALKAKAVALCGHHHMTSEHHGATITGKPQGTWSIGCLCQLNPPYMPLNNWNQGFALVDVDGTGEFSVRNHRIFNGAVV